MRPRRRQRGSATVEIAVALPALVLVLGVALAALQLGVDQVRCVDAARITARLLARGDDEAVARTNGLAVAPRGASVAVRQGGRVVRVTVSAPPPRALAAWGVVPPPTAVAEAVLEGLST